MKNKVPLVAALAVGVVAFFAISSYIKKAEQQAKSQLKGDAVVSAGSDIPQGAVITRAMLATKEVPRQFIPPQAVKGSQELLQITGRKSRVPIKAGQIVLWSDLASETRGGLSSIIPAGEGAFTVSISRGIRPGLIQPSDRVDILSTFTVPKSTQPLPSGVATDRKSVV